MPVHILIPICVLAYPLPVMGICTCWYQHIHQLKSSLENLANKLSKEMNDRKFKLKPQSFTTKVSVRKFDTSNKKISSNIK